jgi:hypothetical protein
LDDETLSGAVTSSLARFEELGGFIRACPAFGRATAEEKQAMRHASPERKKQLLAQRREVYWARPVCDKLNERLLDETDAFTAANVPVICRLSSLAFCNYDSNSELVWNGKTSRESSHRTYDTARRDGVQLTGIYLNSVYMDLIVSPSIL